jgi:glyoxylase-like metal-dependent hydrolase (beta-lactamase superfamily II)
MRIAAAATVAAAAALLSSLPGRAQTDFDKVQIKVQKVAGSVYVLYGAGGNIAVSVGDDGVVMVDDQFAPLAPKVKKAIASITKKPVRFLLNTHWHGDHTGGNGAFAQGGVTILAHENVRKRLAAGNPAPGLTHADPAPAQALPVITFDQSATVHLNGEDIRAVHVPRGEALEKLIPTLPADAKLIPGHGEVAGVEALKTYVRLNEDGFLEMVYADVTQSQPSTAR